MAEQYDVNISITEAQCRANEQNGGVFVGVKATSKGGFDNSSKLHFKTSAVCSEDKFWPEFWTIGGVKDRTKLKFELFRTHKDSYSKKLGRAKYYLRDLEELAQRGGEQEIMLQVRRLRERCKLFRPIIACMSPPSMATITIKLQVFDSQDRGTKMYIKDPKVQSSKNAEK